MFLSNSSLFIVNFPSLCALCLFNFILSFADGNLTESKREREQGMNKTLSGIYFLFVITSGVETFCLFS